MNMKFIEAREHIAKAREALRRGDKESARDQGEKAALLAPDMEDAWLVLTASDSNPQDALAYAQKALEINPQSARARQAVEWASGRLKQAQAGNARVEQDVTPAGDAVSNGRNESAVVDLPKRESKKINPPAESKSKKRIWIYAASLGLLACAALGFAAYSAVTHPAFASIINSAPAPTQENLWAPVDIAKPTITPIDGNALAVQVAPASTLVATLPPLSASLVPTDLPTTVPTDVPTLVPTEAPTFTPVATETPGILAMEIIVDTPTSQYVAPAPAAEAQAYPAKGNGARWIDVNLSEQRVYAYEGDVVVNSFIVSTGTSRTPTVTGKFKIWIKLKSTTMSGPGYYLTNVPYTMYFYKGYGLHGTYWHNNFGTPMSHGCVNLSIPDAAWLYGWAYEGTVVNVHY